MGLLAIATAAGCNGSGGAAGSGDLVVLVEVEDVVIEGLDPGDEVDDIRDGWAIRFDRYLVTLGNIDVHLAADQQVEEGADQSFVVDLTEVPTSGIELWELTDLQADRWNFHYATSRAQAQTRAHASVTDEDLQALQMNEWTYSIEGGMSKTGGQSCPPAALAMPPEEATVVGTNEAGDDCYLNEDIAFRIGSSAPTRYGPCEVDGVPGVSVPAGGTQSVAITIHGDHLFFNGFPEGGEGGVMRLAQWMADSDLDLDGVVTRQELQSITPSDLPELDDRYQLGGSPITPLDDMYQYVIAQLKTQGHFQGEGECPIDGVEHDHG